MAKSTPARSSKDRQWAEARKRCHLNRDDIRMAKELRFNPRTLIKNIPSPSQRWKQPVKQWIRALYEEKKGKRKHDS